MDFHKPIVKTLLSYPERYYLYGEKLNFVPFYALKSVY